MKTISDLEDLWKGSTCIPEPVFAKFRRNFYTKIAVKSSLPARFLTKNFFSLLTLGWWILRFYAQEMRFENVWGCFWSFQTHWTQNMLQFWKIWILPLKPSFLLVFSYSELYATWDLSYGGRFTSAVKSGAVPQVSKTFSEIPKIITKHILEPWSNRNSPPEFASQWRSCTVEFSTQK